jgi:hypothetical protein
MSTATVSITPDTVHPFVDYVADRAASREVDATFDYWGVGRLIVSGELAYEVARDQMVAAFKIRDLATSTVKTYMSQGYALAQLFETFEELEEWADEECNGSRSLKRLYDASRVREPKADAEVSGEGETNAAETVPANLLDVILANLAHLTDAADIAKVRDAAIAMLAPAAVAAA